MQQAYSKLDKSSWGYGASPVSRFNEGWLARTGGHRIYYHEYGNPLGQPVMFLHGGPGGASDAEFTRCFDPAFYRVILFDQRGCGRSTPNVKDDLPAALSHNTTQDLVSDIEALRLHLNIARMQVFGGSWGSTLALAYAQSHPEHITVLVLRGIFTCTKRDIDYFYQGNAAEYDPAKPEVHCEREGAYRAYLGAGDAPFTIPASFRDSRMAAAYARAWRDYVEIIPKAQRGDMIAAYHAILHSPNLVHAEKLKAAIAWSVWEGVTSNLSHDTSPQGVARFADPDFAIAFAAIENHYFYHGAYLRGTERDQQALTEPENITRIAGIPTYIVHGRFDQVCPVFQAHNLLATLKRAGATVEYQEVNCGHSMFERLIAEKLLAFTDGLRSA